MLTVTVLVLLQTPGLISEGAPAQVRLIADEVPAAPKPGVELMSRSEMKAAYDALDAKRPGLVLPVLLTVAGGIGAIVLAIGFWVPFSTPYGLATYAAVLLIAAFVVAVAMVVTGIYLYVRNKPQRDALGAEMEVLEKAWKEGRCREVEGQRPCKNDPNKPAPGFVPQVQVGPEPSLRVATF